MSEHQKGHTIYLLERDDRAITCSHRDLADEMAHEPGGERYEATPLTTDGYRSQPAIEMLWYPDVRRAGLACGADAVWTAADSPEDALERYLEIENKEMSD